MAESATKLDEATRRLLDSILLGLHGEQPINPMDAMSYGRALKAVHDVLGIRTDADLREQEARIAKLRHDAEKDQPDESCGGVVILPEVLPESEEGAVHV